MTVSIVREETTGRRWAVACLEPGCGWPGLVSFKASAKPRRAMYQHMQETGHAVQLDYHREMEVRLEPVSESMDRPLGTGG